MSNLQSLSYYKKHSYYIVIEKRFYHYIFKNNGSIPLFSNEREARTVPPGFATYVGRIKKRKK
jgi:hypothetical protein